ncbi:MAG: SMP-30/gluconolactonase/LRE family protein [Devosia sp.]
MNVRVECALDVKAQVGECPLWDVEEQALYFVDIEGCTVHRYDPATAGHTAHTLDERVACLAMRKAGGALIGTQSGLHTFDFATGAKSPIVDPEADKPHNRVNDSAIAPEGRWWVGTMSMAQPQPADGAFYVFADGELTKVFDGIYTTNGLAFSPDGSRLYFSDSHRDVRTVWCCDYDAQTGTPSNRRVFFDTRSVAGRPDGATVDIDGCYWLAGVGGWEVYRITPDGRVDMTIKVPVERPSKPMFGGPGLDTLFLTSIAPDSDQPLAGGLLAITGLPVGGLPQPRLDY